MSLRESELNKIWDEVQENARKLDACTGGHDFSVDLDPDKTLGKHYGCTKCGGRVSSIHKYYYDLGRTHGAVVE